MPSCVWMDLLAGHCARNSLPNYVCCVHSTDSRKGFFTPDTYVRQTHTLSFFMPSHHEDSCLIYQYCVAPHRLPYRSTNLLNCVVSSEQLCRSGSILSSHDPSDLNQLISLPQQTSASTGGCFVNFFKHGCAFIVHLMWDAQYAYAS